MILQQANAPPKTAAVGCFYFGLVPVIVFFVFYVIALERIDSNLFGFVLRIFAAILV